MKNIILSTVAVGLLATLACKSPAKINTPSMPSNSSVSTPVSDAVLPQLGKSPMRDVINALTLEEKANLAIGMGFSIPGLPPLATIDPLDLATPEKVLGAAGRTHAVPRLGIPSITVSDGPAGVRIQPIRNNDKSKTYYATAFPIASALASTWDTELVKNLGIAFGNEVREYGIDVLLAPAMNIHRNSLGGRNFEYYSEDPMLSGKIAAAIVNGVQTNGVGVSVKHFAVNNNEFNRTAMNVHISERALREIYLRNFQYTVQNSNPWTFMSSYNLINGTYTSQSRALLDTILRQEWGFKGMIMTDWFGGKDAVEQMKAGNDLLMPGTTPQKQAIIEAVNDKRLTMNQLDANIERVLTLVLKSPTFLNYKYSDAPDLKNHAEVSRNAAREGMVLLKNDNVLPLATSKKVALFGNTSYALIAGGTGSGDVNKAYMISLDKGLADANFNVNADLATAYATHIVDEKAKQPRPKTPFDPKVALPEMKMEGDKLSQLVADNDVAIITIGKNSGEFADRQLAVDFNLTEGESALINTVSTAFRAKNKKTIVVLNIGGVIETVSWRDKVDAILLSWQAGQETGHAIADILRGSVNPSAKLPTTFPINYSDEASSKNFPGKELPFVDDGKPKRFFDAKPSEAMYEEGIYVGYRYFNTFNVKTAYPFGFGLSYTTFKYSNLKLSATAFKDKITATVTVTNTGKVAGKEVVQLYLRTPDRKISKPDSELKAFGKTKLLQSNQSETLTFTLSANELASFNTAATAWMADAGTYTVKIGSSSVDTKETATFTLNKDIVTEKVHKVLVPKMEIKEIRK